jgi:tetratricopeptide (TPR) repeat protein
MSRARTLALTLALSLAAGVASGQERNREFDRLVRQAASAYDAHDSASAVTALERAYALRPVPRLLFNLGRAHEQRNDYATAADYYRRFLATSPDPQSTAVAQEALGIAERQVARQAEEQRQRDAAAAAERQRSLDAARAQTLAAEQQRLEDERRRQSALTRPRRITTPVAIAWGVAGAGVVAGGILGGLALAARSDFDADRNGQARFDASSRASSMALGADIAFGTAVVAGVTGLVLFLIQPTTVAPTEAGQ